MPTLSQLEYVLAVANTQHFGKAAEACHIAQPSLSMQILKAEREAGFSFFDRLKRPIALTPQGKEFVAQAKTVLSELARLRQLSQPAGSPLRGALRLGVIPTLAPYLVSLFIKKFAQACPGVHLQIDELPTAALLENLREGRLDAGVAATPLHEPGFHEAVLFDEAFYLYAHPDDPLLKKKRISPSDLQRKNLWLLTDGHCFRNQVLRLCSTRPVYPAFANVSFEGGTLETLRQLIRHNGGTTLVPELFVQNLPVAERYACVRPFNRPVPSRQISLLYRLRSGNTGLLQGLQQSIQASLPKEVRVLHPTLKKTLPVDPPKDSRYTMGMKFTGRIR